MELKICLYFRGIHKQQGPYEQYANMVPPFERTWTFFCQTPRNHKDFRRPPFIKKMFTKLILKIKNRKQIAIDQFIDAPFILKFLPKLALCSFNLPKKSALSIFFFVRSSIVS